MKILKASALIFALSIILGCSETDSAGGTSRVCTNANISTTGNGSSITCTGGGEDVCNDSVIKTTGKVECTP